MNLLLFLSNRCNMRCDYCFLDLNQGPAVALDADAAHRACASHLDRHPRGGQFTFLGGEPLIHYSVLRATAARVRAVDQGRSRIHVVTNGTLLSAPRVRELQGLGVEITVSLDGRSRHHDRHRRLARKRDESSLAAALEALESCDKKAIKVNMVVGEDTAPFLLSNIEFLRASGFSRLSFHLNLTQAWSDRGLETLRRSLEGLLRYHELLSAAGSSGLEISNLAAVAGAAAERDSAGLVHSYEELILGADGRYYPCDGLFVLPYSQLGRWAVGEARSGVDWRRRETLLSECRDFIHRHIERKRHYHCPRETYFHALAAGRDPAEAIRAFHRADNIFGDALSQLARRRRRTHALSG